MDEKPIGKDATGYEVITDAVKELLNQFPGLYKDEVVKFEDIRAEDGIGFSADNGALVYSQKKDVLGYVNQKCRYPFYIVYRTSSKTERSKLSIQGFLDTFGKWLCMEQIVLEGIVYKLDRYPHLASGRKIEQLIRDNSYGLEPAENGVQDWILPVTVEYTNKFKK